MRGAALGAILAAAAAPALAADAPISRGMAATVFASAVTLDCLLSRDNGGGIADLTGKQLVALRPAVGKERFLYKDPAVAVWTADEMAGNLMVAERAAESCEVIASDLHVEAAFDLTIKAARAMHPDFVSVPIRAGYNPIVYQLERQENGVRTVLHLEGAEPGGLFHTMRFSLLKAEVIRQPASAKPPYR